MAREIGCPVMATGETAPRPMSVDHQKPRRRDILPASEPVSIAVCVGGFLPPSETFIYDQLKNARRTRPWVLARYFTKNHQQFPFDDVVTLGAPEWWAYYYAGQSITALRALRGRRPRLVHAHFGLNGAMVLPLAKRLRLPLVVSFHGHDVGGLEPQNRYSARYFRYQRMARAMFDYCSLLLCASIELKELLLQHGAPEHKLVVHHLGVDTAVFRPPERGQRSGNGRLLMVGRLVEKKGMEFGLRAFARVAQERPQSRLAIVGQGPLLGQLRALTGQMQLAEKVEFLGALTPQGVREQMALADVLLTPSVTTAKGDRESGVIVIKEAGAMALPTVASRHGGIGEIIDDGQNGYLVEERDVPALAQRLGALLDDPIRCEKMGRLARQLVEQRYDTRVQNERLESLLISAADGHSNNER